MSDTFIVKTTDCLLYQEEAKMGDLKVVGRYSCDMDYQMKDDLSQVMYYNPPQDDYYKRLVNFNLDEKYDEIVKQRTETGPIPIEMVCFYKWLAQHANDVKGNPEESKRLDADFILMRSLLKEMLLVKSRASSKGWIICAAKFQGSIYLCGFETKERKAWSAAKYNDKTLLYRHKFKKFIFSEKPNTRPDPKQPVYEIDEFCCVFERTLGDHKLLFRADVDGVISDKLLEDPVDWSNVKFVELRTNFVGPYHQKNFIKRTLVQWWALTHITDVDHVLCGFRTDDGVVEELKTYTPAELVTITRGCLNPQACLNFANEFLTYVKEKVINDYDQTIYKFEWHPSAEQEFGEDTEEEVIMTEINPDYNPEYKFLEDWFVSQMSDNV